MLIIIIIIISHNGGSSSNGKLLFRHFFFNKEIANLFILSLFWEWYPTFILWAIPAQQGAAYPH